MMFDDRKDNKRLKIIAIRSAEGGVDALGLASNRIYYYFVLLVLITVWQYSDRTFTLKSLIKNGLRAIGTRHKGCIVM